MSALALIHGLPLTGQLMLCLISHYHSVNKIQFFLQNTKWCAKCKRPGHDTSEHQDNNDGSGRKKEFKGVCWGCWEKGQRHCIFIANNKGTSIAVLVGGTVEPVPGPSESMSRE
eukprot:3304570-Rhodomonas_salina.1